MKLKFSRREQILLAVFIIVITAYSYYRFLYLPIHEARLQLMAENTRMQALLQQSAAELAQEKYDTDAIRQEYAGLASKLPSAPYLPEILSSLNKTAQDKGVTLLAFNYNSNTKEAASNPAEVLLQKNLPADSNNKTNSANNNTNKNTSSSLQELKFNIKAQGGYYNISSYILALEKQDRILLFQSLKLEAGGKKEDSQPVDELGNPLPQKPSALVDGNNITCSLELSAFYDQNSFENITGIEEVETGTGKENPFQG